MRNLLTGEVKPDDEVMFYDGMLLIICRDKNRLSEEMITYDRILCAEYDDPITLADIVKDFPNVYKLIFEDPLKGYVYNYGNHPRDPEPEMWELVGEILGYA